VGFEPTIPASEREETVHASDRTAAVTGAYMTQGMKKEPILQMGTDRMLLRHVYDKPFTVRFSDRVNGKTGFNPIGKVD
jgi:hypothetical protein